MPLILGTNSIKDTGFNVANSWRNNNPDSSYMHITPGSTGNKKIWTFSTWLKRSKLSYDCRIFSTLGSSGSAYGAIQFGSDDKFVSYSYNGSGNDQYHRTNRQFRDTAAWLHIVMAVDTTQSTAGNRTKIYFNGVQETSWVTETIHDQNDDSEFNHDTKWFLGAGDPDDDQLFPFGGYMAEAVWIDGTQYAASDFGEFDSDSGIWKPIDVSGLTFGTNGFYLDFKASGNLGNDANGGTDLTEVNLDATNQSTDTCTNNFATLNPLSTGNKQAQRHVTLSEGNLFAVGNSSSNNGNAYTTIAVNTGKWYCEIKATDVRGTGYPYIGVCNETCHNQGGQAGLDSSSGVDGVAYSPDGRKNINGTSSSYGNSFTDNDIIGIALDLDNGAVYFSKNGTFQASGDPTSGASKTNAVHTFTVGDHYFFALSVFEAASDVSCNFGSPAFAISSGNTDGNGFGNFEYAVPSGYFALCTKNLAENG